MAGGTDGNAIIQEIPARFVRRNKELALQQVVSVNRRLPAEDTVTPITPKNFGFECFAT